MNGQLAMLSEVLRGAAAVMGVPWSRSNGVDVATFQLLIPIVAARVEQAWMRYPWPEITISARRYQDQSREEWSRPSGGSSYAKGSIVLHRATNAYYEAMEAADADEVPGESLSWVKLIPRDPSDYNGFDPTLAYSKGDVVYWPDDGSFRYCVTSTGPLSTPQVPQWVTITNWTGYFDYAPVETTDVRFIQPEWIRIGGVTGAWDKSPLRLDACPLAVELQPTAFRVEGHPASCWVRASMWCPTITGDLWDSSQSYAAGSQVYYQNPTTGEGTWYDINATLAAGVAPTTNALSYWPLRVPRRLVPHLQAAVAADWLRIDGQVDKAGERENAAAQAMTQVIMDLVKRQKQTGQLPVSSR